MSTLVYVGANAGNSLWGLFNNFDRVYAFEPDPEIFAQLSRRYKQFEWVTLINAACSFEDGESVLNVHPNRVSSSLSTIDVENYGGDPTEGTVKIKTVNLLNFLKKENIDYIDLYYSDCQGSDLNVLTTLKEFVDNKKIAEMFMETHGNGIFLYKGLDNQFSSFKKLLEENYEFGYASLGRLDGKIVSESDIPEGEYEWDSYWRVR
jgi:FkbM family methyltransferase